MTNMPSRMNTKIPRREFVQTVGYAGAALATLPGVAGRAAEPSGKPVILGFVGCAHIHTPGFITVLNRRKEVQVKYVWDHDLTRARRRAPHLDAEVVADVATIWSDPEVQGVVICSETNRHYELVHGAARAGKHMFVEKPLGMTAVQSRSMAAAIEEAGVRFTTGYFMRGTPAHLFLKEQMARGALGKVTRVQAWNCHAGSLGGWFDAEWRWMADPEQSGVGGFGDLGTHILDILMWTCGEVESATGDIKIVTGRYENCDESGTGLLRFRNGITGSITAGWIDVANPVSLLVSGTEGHAMILNGDLYLQCANIEGADGKQPWKELPPARSAPLEQFVDALAGKEDVHLVTPSEAAARVSVMEAMYLGSRERRWFGPA
jgi:predicted dehydrogenase